MFWRAGSETLVRWGRIFGGGSPQTLGRLRLRMVGFGDHIGPSLTPVDGYPGVTPDGARNAARA